ncbi:hypothetical protein [Cryobacterium sp. MLB-32]
MAELPGDDIGRHKLAQQEVRAHPVGGGLMRAVGEQPAVEVFE